jgi:hypothetical protein
METRFPTTPQLELLLVDDEVTNLQLLRQILAPTIASALPETAPKPCSALPKACPIWSSWT